MSTGKQSGNGPRPPRLARMLLKWFTGGELREEVRGDLEELYARRVKQVGERKARRRLYRDVLSTARLLFRGSKNPGLAQRQNKGDGIMQNLLQDLRYGARALWRKPGFTVVVVLTLALGIGANTAIFSVVNAVLLTPLPYPEPGRLVRIDERQSKGRTLSTAWLNYTDWHEQNKSFEKIAAYQVQGYNLAADGEPLRVSGWNVTANLFDMLGAQPLLGRTFLPQEDQPGSERVVILSHRLWRQLFGANPEVLGETLTLDGRPYTVIGVMSLDFRFPNRYPPLWTSLGFHADANNNRGNHPGIRTLGRLREGVSLTQADQDLNTIAKQLAEQFPVTNGGHGVRLTPYEEFTVRDSQPVLLLLFGAVGFVLLIGCANVANLLLARTAGRQKELAIRAALGAGRLRLVRQLLTESLLLGLLGGTAGIALAFFGLDLLQAILPENTPRLEQVQLDWRVGAFAIALSLLTGVLFGLLPAFLTARTDLHATLKEGGRNTGQTGGHRLRHALVVAEVALALVLLVGAGLMIRSFYALNSATPGFDPSNLLTLQLSLSGLKHSSGGPQTRINFTRELLERVRLLPGVESAATTYPMPLSQDGWQTVYVTEDNPQPPLDDLPWTENQRVSPGYFRTMGIPLLKGRVFTDQDDADAQRVIIVDENFVQKHWPGENAVGKRIKIGFPDSNGPWRTIVGVAGHVKLYGVARNEGSELYFPQLQNPIRPMQLVLRTERNPETLISAVRREVLAIDPAQPIFNILPMSQLLDQTIQRQQTTLQLLSIFAALAMGLAAVGIYGVISYSVSQRTHEIGVRMALGARGVDVLQMVLRQGMGLVLLGLVLGLAAAFALTRLLESMLFGVSTSDPMTFAVVAALLGLVAMLACLVPARRASQVDPMVALRYE